MTVAADRRTPQRTWGARALLGVLLVGAVIARVEASDRRADAWAAQVRADAAVEAHRRAEVAVGVTVADVSLAERAAGVRARQVATARTRLARAGITEPTLDAVVESEGSSAEEAEAARDATAAAVARQAAALPELKGCLTAAERAAAVAFNATSDDDIVIPAPSALCVDLLEGGG